MGAIEETEIWESAGRVEWDKVPIEGGMQILPDASIFRERRRDLQFGAPTVIHDFCRREGQDRVPRRFYVQGKGQSANGRGRCERNGDRRFQTKSEDVQGALSAFRLSHRACTIGIALTIGIFVFYLLGGE